MVRLPGAADAAESRFVDFINEFGFVLPKSLGMQLNAVSITNYNV
jgi:hypothetical protein